MRDDPIGVLDSGVGGISVLREAAALMPCERFIYYGDNANAPYGVRPPDEILALTLKAADFLLERGVKALLIACNTAASVAEEHLRNTLSIPVVGIEPALKAAQALRRGGKILAMGTPATLSLPRFAQLMQRYGQDVLPLPVRGLVERIEGGETCGPQMEEFLRQLFASYRDMTIDAVVLGCTHYPFVKGAISRVLGPGVDLVDGGADSARQLRRELELLCALRTEGQGGVRWHTSGDEAAIVPLMKRLMAQEPLGEERGIDQ